MKLTNEERCYFCHLRIDDEARLEWESDFIASLNDWDWVNQCIDDAIDGTENGV